MKDAVDLLNERIAGLESQLAGKDSEIARLQTMVKNLEEPETFYRVGEVEHKEALQDNNDD
jgi:cell division protein FtsL